MMPLHACSSLHATDSFDSLRWELLDYVSNPMKECSTSKIYCNVIHRKLQFNAIQTLTQIKPGMKLRVLTNLAFYL